MRFTGRGRWTGAWLRNSSNGIAGLKAVRYLVPEMKEILSNTFGVLVYQEQIMQLAQKTRRLHVERGGLDAPGDG